ncbi:MAG: hypothetical protein CMO01_01390 [Thalassobius sp.]|nr:hypothetical protein [Thalassovita sp.]
MEEQVQDVIHYPNGLLKIETGQQCKQLEIFDDEGELKKEFRHVNEEIGEVLKLNNNGANYSIEFPREIEQKVPEKYRKSITKELTANEVRILTAIVVMAQKAKSVGKLYYLDKIDRAYFEFNPWDLYKCAGLEKDKSGRYDKRQKEFVKQALVGLDHKKFFIPVRKVKKVKGKILEYTGIKIERLIEIHEIGEWKKEGDMEGRPVMKLTVDSVFFDFKREKKQTYFNIPTDLNNRIRKVNIGRPNTSVELFIKCLYQVCHMADKDKVEYSYNRLVEIMKLDKYRINKHHSRIDKTINKAFETARKLMIINDWEETKSKHGSKKYILHISKGKYLLAS